MDRYSKSPGLLYVSQWLPHVQWFLGKGKMNSVVQLVSLLDMHLLLPRINLSGFKHLEENFTD